MSNMNGQRIKDPVAYCALHHFAMTQNDVQKRKCLDRHCFHFRRMKHPWWEYRKKQREMRAERKRHKAAIWKREETR